ncbi:MAG TPA: hypothetical protein VFH68_00945 [Polyangia bacterium]|nr:hypothetical protein [Polyangia bacterium]
MRRRRRPRASLARGLVLRTVVPFAASPVAVAAGAPPVGVPCWSPDGQRAAFVSYRRIDP